MGNPLSDVSQSFWDLVNWVDGIMIGIGATNFGYEPLAPQFEYLQKVDTDEIRRIADEVWQRQSGLVHRQFEQSQELIGQAERTLQSWQGEAKEAYLRAVRQPFDAMERSLGPVHSLSEELHKLADGYDHSLIDVISETIDATKGVWKEVPDSEPEDRPEAIVTIIVWLIAILTSIVVFFKKQYDAAKTNIDNVSATIDDCKAIAASAR